MVIGSLVIDDDGLKALCEEWGVAELAVFGSVLRADFGPQSDVDFLVTWLPGRMPTLFRMFDMKVELANLVGRPIDLIQRHVVEHDRNQFRRKDILDGAQCVYAAA